MKQDFFKKSIETYLNQRAQEDPLFANTLAKENKSIDECLSYILSEVKKSGRQGFADEEIYGLAVHYYDEDDLKAPSGKINARVVIGGQIDITEEEKAEAKQKALEALIDEEKQKLKKKSVKKSTESESVESLTLF